MLQKDRHTDRRDRKHHHTAFTHDNKNCTMFTLSLIITEHISLSLFSWFFWLVVVSTEIQHCTYILM